MDEHEFAENIANQIAEYVRKRVKCGHESCIKFRTIIVISLLTDCTIEAVDKLIEQKGQNHDEQEIHRTN